MFKKKTKEVYEGKDNAITKTARYASSARFRGCLAVLLLLALTVLMIRSTAAITTAQQPVQELALTAVQRLMYRIAHPDVKDKMTACIPVMVLERQSVRKL